MRGRRARGGRCSPARGCSPALSEGVFADLLFTLRDDRQPGGLPGLEAADHVRCTGEPHVLQDGGREAQLEARVAHDDLRPLGAADALVARARARVAAPLEDVARDEDRSRDDAVAGALGLRADVDDHGAVGERGHGRLLGCHALTRALARSSSAWARRCLRSLAMIRQAARGAAPLEPRGEHLDEEAERQEAEQPSEDRADEPDGEQTPPGHGERRPATACFSRLGASREPTPRAPPRPLQRLPWRPCGRSVPRWNRAQGGQQ